MSVTAKVFCAAKVIQNEGTNYESWMVTFAPDYGDGRNKEWSVATPYLHLQMTLKGEVARRFEAGKHYTLTFDEETTEVVADGDEQ